MHSTVGFSRCILFAVAGRSSYGYFRSGPWCIEALIQHSLKQLMQVVFCCGGCCSQALCTRVVLLMALHALGTVAWLFHCSGFLSLGLELGPPKHGWSIRQLNSSRVFFHTSSTVRDISIYSVCCGANGYRWAGQDVQGWSSKTRGGKFDQNS